MKIQKPCRKGMMISRVFEKKKSDERSEVSGARNTSLTFIAMTNQTWLQEHRTPVLLLLLAPGRDGGR
jgi:hypothetical protein